MPLLGLLLFLFQRACLRNLSTTDHSLSLPPPDIITFLVVDLSHLNQLSKGPLDCDLVSTLLPCFAELLTV